MTQLQERTAWLDSPGVTRLLKVVAILSLLLAVGVGVQQARLTSCLAAYNEASNLSSRARTEAAEADRKAVDDMVKAIAEARRAPDPAGAVDQALGGYLQARAFADGQRAGNPLPGPPSQTCG